jgi:radical SAM protein with 4Fe4S-binding SPASM domain
MKVAFHTINGVGLGHVVRAVTLASEMRELVPGIELLVLTNARDTSLIARAGLDFVKLPPRLSGEPHTDPERARTSLPEPLEEAALVAALATFRPDLVVFDTHAPTRLVREATALGARTVLVLRELRRDALRTFAASPVSRAFDRIVVPHEPGEMDLEPLAALPVVLVGPIVRSLQPAGDRAPNDVVTSGARDRRSRVASGPLVVATAGGGGQPVDARRYLRAVADAHLLARARFPTLETVLVTGPYGEPPTGVDRYSGLTVLRSTPELGELLARATLVVSQAGYNAVAELRALGKPAVLVPGYRKAEDQRARALRLARAGAAVLAKPEARAIADRVEALLASEDKLASMSRAHQTIPLVARNREAATAVLGPVWRPASRRPVKVAIVAHDFAPRLGGMETVARGLAASLVARGVDVRVYTANRLGAREASRLGDVVEPLYPPLPPPARIDLGNDLLRTIDAALRDAPDVIHLCHAGLGPWIPALRAALPCVVTANVHGNDLLVPWVRSESSPDAYRAAQIAGLSSADAVLAVSRFSESLARSRGVRSAVLHTIENGVDTSRFCPGPRDLALARRLSISDDDELVLTVSRLAPRKGHLTVLEAVAKLAARRPRLKFVFTGASTTLRVGLAQRAETLGIASRVVAAGIVPDAELPALYRLARVFALLTSDAEDDVEGFGVALLEAAASGLPTIASRTGGMPEAIVDGETGLLVPPGDAAAAAHAIERLLDDAVFARRLAERGRDRVVRELGTDRAADRVLTIWSDLLQRAPRTLERTERSSSRLLFSADSGVELVRRAQEDGATRRAAQTVRRRTFQSIVERGQLVRLRATGDGARLLPDALADCAALGHAPRVEVKLRRFLEPDFALYALPRVESVELVHGVPHHGARSLYESLQAMPDEALRRVRLVRIFLTPEARETPALATSAVPEIHALRRFFSERGAVVVPPPELMRYLAELPAGGPETGMIEPTNLCNLACPTCPTGTGKVKPLPQMTLARFDHVLGELAPRLQNLALWNYGEPLLNKELPGMIAHAKKMGVRVVKVSSNVHFLDGDRGRALLRSRLDVLILSVDGASQETYAAFRKDGDFDRVARSVAWLCAEKKRLELTKPRIELQFIVMRHNEHELPEMRRLAREWGVDRLRVKTVGADDAETKELIPATRLLSRYQADGQTPNVRHAFCTMAWDHTVVNVDGSVTPCCYLRPDMGEAFVMGNVFESSFAEIWRGERYRAFRAAMLAGRESMPVCNRCRGGTHDLLAAVEAVG